MFWWKDNETSQPVSAAEADMKREQQEIEASVDTMATSTENKLVPSRAESEAATAAARVAKMEAAARAAAAESATEVERVDNAVEGHDTAVTTKVSGSRSILSRFSVSGRIKVGGSGGVGVGGVGGGGGGGGSAGSGGGGNTTAVVVPAKSRSEWEAHGGGVLEAVLRSGAIGLLDAYWVLALFEKGGRIERRQDLPPEAFVSLDQLIYVGARLGSLSIIVVS